MQKILNFILITIFIPATSFGDDICSKPSSPIFNGKAISLKFNIPSEADLTISQLNLLKSEQEYSKHFAANDVRSYSSKLYKLSGPDINDLAYLRSNANNTDEIHIELPGYKSVKGYLSFIGIMDTSTNRKGRTFCHSGFLNAIFDVEYIYIQFDDNNGKRHILEPIREYSSLIYIDHFQE